METEDIVQILANLYPEAIPAEAYEDTVNLVVAQVRSEMFRKKTLVNGKWVDVDGTAAPHIDRMAEVLQSKQPPMNGIRGTGRRYDLPSDSEVKALHAEDTSRYPSIRAVADKVQRDLASGALQVDDRALHGNSPVVEVPGAGGSKRLVPRFAVPEAELHRIDRADAAKTAEQFKHHEPTSVQVGTPKPTAVPAWEKPVSFNDIMMGPSMPKPMGR